MLATRRAVTTPGGLACAASPHVSRQAPRCRSITASPAACRNALPRTDLTPALTVRAPDGGTLLPSIRRSFPRDSPPIRPSSHVALPHSSRLPAAAPFRRARRHGARDTRARPRPAVAPALARRRGTVGARLQRGARRRALRHRRCRRRPHPRQRDEAHAAPGLVVGRP